MSDIMRPISFDRLLSWVLNEYEKEGTIFGISKLVRYSGKEALPIFDEKIEAPFGPAAGPNTQMAQNLIAAYVSGARFFELKTVQVVDGRELASKVPKPCIASDDEGYNCEWSTELEVGHAYEEYVKAWFIIRILAKELELGDPDAFVFNMSVGYDLEGIKSPKVNSYIDEMLHAAGTKIYEECKALSLKAAAEGKLKKADAEFIGSFPTRISGSITESTLHGCPPDEIERIAAYLITEKGLNTYIKLNPTLLGYEFARKTLDSLGFDYIAFDDHHFLEDLQWEDAVPMLERLQKLAGEKGLEFGVKLTNTFPVDVKGNELPSQEMYMSGRALFPLTTELCRRFSRQFDGKLRISYSGGADYFNIDRIFDAGIWPITLATAVLKPGGYQRMAQIAAKLSCKGGAFTGVDVEKTAALARYALEDGRYKRLRIKQTPERKNGKPLPLLDCFSAPCREGCPIGQDIPAYLNAMEEGDALRALEIILQKNALPFTTGTICPHTCMNLCMRNCYEGAVHIRKVKLLAAKSAYPEMREKLAARTAKPVSGKKVAVIGGGPAGLSAAAFLGRAGIPVTVFEKLPKAGGVPRYAIPGFRISDEAIDADVDLCTVYGAKLETGREITSLEELKSEGFTDFVVAIGAWKHGKNALKYGEALDTLEFLQEVKAKPDSLELGEDVVVIGGGNTAMDVARAAKRQKGVRNVRLVYRRDRKNMPADEEELQMALDDGVEFAELLGPVGKKDSLLECSVMKLGAPDGSGRRSPEETGETRSVKADTVITAVGEQIDDTLYKAIGVELDGRGRPVVNEHGETSVPGVYAAGDACQGPATVVKAIAGARLVAADIVAKATGRSYEDVWEEMFEKFAPLNAEVSMKKALSKKGNLTGGLFEEPDRRCLACSSVCEVCVDVCPNRANIAVTVPGLTKPQILHVEGMCNECGNCAVFCPYNGHPYKDKFTLFRSFEEFRDSTNAGFLPTADPKVTRVRLFDKVTDVDVSDPNCGLYEPLRKLILTVREAYPWLIG